MAATPAWLPSLLGVDALAEGEAIDVGGQPFVVRDGIPRAQRLVSEQQAATGEAFGFKWRQRDSFTRDEYLALTREWLVARHGEVSDAPWWADYGPEPVVLDAGCGGGVSGMELFGRGIEAGRLRYLGVDLTDAVDVAAERFAERGLEAAFLQADLVDLPLARGAVDVVFSEGVMHHTDSTREAMRGLAALLDSGGRFLFYVYRRKGPIREFTDDLLREKLQAMTPEEGWEALKPLTALGEALGRLDVTLDVPEAIDLLDIPAGPIDLQRFFYWHIFKAYYRPEITFDEMHHLNYDWYAPANAFRHTEEEVRGWCEEEGFDVEREDVQPAGITIQAVKR